MRVRVGGRRQSHYLLTYVLSYLRYLLAHLAGRVFLAQLTLNALPLVLPQRALPPLARKGELRLPDVLQSSQ